MYGVDNKETFAFVAKMSTVQVLLSVAVNQGSLGKLVVIIYVDDLIITGDNMDEIVSFKRKYVLDLLQEVGMLDCKPIITPLDCKLKLDTAGELLTHFMHAPTVTHLHVVKKILRYLKGSIRRGILMRNNGSTQIQGYTDADWAGNALDRKSTTGYCTFLVGNLVTWKSKKQNVIARSSAKAEYRAMASTACELIWLKSLLFDLGFPSNATMPLMCDNQAAMHIASYPVFHKHTKHIEVDCHYVRA
ncbi:secreted RxLR effector protein 161-like [Malus domestica]|uniref:secreted RxLR effector protein 161-like n=1 Tax=Malus domestica TaxID=3750 RepID=UPI003976AF99